MALHLNGQKETAIRRLREGTRGSDLHEGMILPWLSFGLCFIHMLDGKCLLAFQDGLRLREACSSNRLAFVDTLAIYVQGNSSFQMFDLDAARHNLSLVVENRYMANPRASVDAMAGQAITSQFMGKPDEADQMMNLAQEYAKWTKEPGHLEIVSSCRARLALLRGDPGPASRWQKSLSEPTGYPLLLFFLEVPVITECRVLIATGSDAGLKEAIERLDDLLQKSKAWHNSCQAIDIMVLQSLASHRQGLLKKALEFLEQAVAMAMPGGSIRPFVEPGPVMVHMVKRLAKKNLYVDYIRQILAAFRSEKTETVRGLANNQTVRVQPLIDPLSKREFETLTLLAKGHSNKEIASKLFLSPETVKKHVYNIYQKLNVKSRVSASSKAKELGILFPD
jgi:LuxR family maltose regulon positive regulatory protein